MAGDEASVAAFDRFLKRVPNYGGDGCWLWAGHLSSGYGYIRVDGVRMGAHRYSWEFHSGKTIPEGLFVDHLCMQRACVNPAHLEPVSNRENLIRAAEVLRPTCKEGHPFDGRYPGTGWRYCKTCVGDANRTARRLRKARLTA